MNNRAITYKELRQKIGLGRSTIFELEKVGKFPKRRKFGLRNVRWIESEVDQWIQEREVAE